MIEEHIDIQTKDGAMNTFITRPDQGGPFPVIVFLMDAPGKREELHDMARRIATVGYYVMLPNLYYRQVREFVVGPDTREIMFGYMNSLSNSMVCEDVGVLLQHAAQEVLCLGRYVRRNAVLPHKDCLLERLGGFPLEGQRAGQHLKEDRADENTGTRAPLPILHSSH